MASAEYLQAAVILRLSDILYAEEALRDLGMFAFVTSHIFYAGGRKSSTATELLCLIDRMEDLHTKVSR